MQYYYKRLAFFTVTLFISLISFSQKKIEQTVYFGFDRSNLSKMDKISLDSMVSIIKPLKNVRIQIDGYTDDRGTEIYNDKLATKRAKTVYEYFVQQGIDTLTFTFFGKGKDLLAKDLTDIQKRKATISIEIENDLTYSFYGEKGTEVIAEENVPLNIVEYFTTETMLRDSMYALDENNNILETGGMISICKKYDELDKTGKFYIVKIPARGLTEDRNMSIWLMVKNKFDQSRWQLTTIKLVYDDTNQLFSFKVPVGTQDCIKINLDKPSGPIYNTAVVYISTYRPFNFSDIMIRNNYSYLSFSAKLNDSLYAFIKKGNEETKNMWFSGKAMINGKDSLLQIALDNCIYTLGSNGNERYYLCEECFEKKSPIILPSQVPPAPEVKPKAIKKRKGFFKWIADLFRKK